MAHAYKCDRCKEYFTQQAEPSKYEIKIADKDESIHLCDQCIKDFKYWWNTVIRAKKG